MFLRRHTTGNENVSIGRRRDACMH
jgi:hypothetical protein